MDKNLVFIASAGRTGTQFFGRELSRVIEDCFSVHEPDILFGADTRLLEQLRAFGGWHMIGGRLLGMTGVRVVGHRLMAGTLAEEKALARIKKSRQRYFSRIPQSLVVESNGQWWYLAHRISRIWPAAKMISIVRDPRSWVQSWRNRQGRYDERDWARLLPPRRLSPKSLGDTRWSVRWDELPMVGKLAWEWRTVNSHLQASAVANPNQRLFRFEDVFSRSDGTVLRELVEFAASHELRTYRVASLDGFTSAVRNASHGNVPGWQHWPLGEVRLVEEICGDLMRQLGYGTEPEWLSRTA